MATPFGDDPANNENNSRITPNGDNKVQIGSRAVGGSGAPGSNRRAQRPELALDAFLEAVTEKRRRSQSRRIKLATFPYSKELGTGVVKAI